MTERLPAVTESLSSQSIIEEASLTLRLFGPFEARVGGTPMPRLRSRRGQWLLALLALRAGKPVERTWLAGTLWPDSTEENALVSLRQTLTDLRRALALEGKRLHSPTSRTLALDVSGASIDLLSFDAAIKRGDPASLEDAVRLHQRPLLEDCQEEWAVAERGQREQACLAALQTLATEAIAQGRYDTAVTALRRVIAADPFREEAHRDLMAALAAAGNPGEAMWVYRDLRLLLRRELNSEPSPETRALHQRLRAEGRRVVSVESAPAPSRTASLAGGGILPRPLTELVGREHDVAEIGRCLFRSRLTTLTGIGGVGKTRLAIQVAEVWAEDQPEGVAFVDLAPLADPSLVPQAVATACGVTEQAGNPMQATLSAALRDRRLLLVLDNCEHLLDACAQLAALLLAECPALSILATSRQPLGITGETLWAVSPLSLPKRSAGMPTQEIAASPAVHLFVERAASVLPGFACTDGNADAIAQICLSLDGIPLALELAAARARILSPEQIAQRLDDRFRLLTGGSRTLLPRQQTLRALIDWSYDLLSEKERRLLMRLSVLAGGWTLEAAEAICSGEGFEDWEVLDLLTGLVDKSLVQSVFDGVVGEGTERRCRMLETVREYARHRLDEAQETEAVQRRHRDYFLALLEEANAARRGPQQPAWFGRLEAEHDNLRIALENCWREESHVSRPGEHSLVLQMANHMRLFWQTRGHVREGRRWMQMLLAAGIGTRVQRARACSNQGLLAMSQADVNSAWALYEEGLALFREAGDLRGMGDVLNNQGIVAWWRDDYALARDLYEQSLAVDRQLNDQFSMADVLNNLGLVAHCQADFPQARAYLDESLALRRSAGDRQGVANSLLNLAVVYSDFGDDTPVLAYLEESLTLLRELGQWDGTAMCLDCLGRLLTRRGEGERAAVLLQESLSLQREIGDKRGIADVLASLSELALSQGDAARAWELRREQLALREEVGEKRLLASALEATARLALGRGEPLKAVRLCAAADSLRHTIGAPLSPIEQDDHAKVLDGLREALSPAAFEADWQAGQVLTPSEAVSYALKDEHNTPPK